MLAQQFNDYLNGLTSTEETSTPASIEDIIAEGESDEMEFKSSLRWDYQQEKTNKKLEEVVIKTVAAFANSQGGTLLIGVNDNGEALGLEKDYLTLVGDKDKFERHLRGLLNNSLGLPFTSKGIKATFPWVDGHEICQIDVLPAKEPIVIKFKDHNGQPIEKLFVRNGNSSQELPISELHNYSKDRF